MWSRPRSMSLAWYRYACCGHPMPSTSPRRRACELSPARSNCTAEVSGEEPSRKVSIHLLHLRGLVRSALDLLKRREVIIAKTLVVVVDAQAEFDHAVDAPRELRGLVQVEARGQQRSVEQKPDQILDGLVGLVCCGLLLQLRHDRVLRVHLHSLLRHHVRGHRVIPQRLGLHDALHVRRPTVLRCGEHAWRVDDSRAYHHLFYLVSQDLLHEFGQRLELRLELLELLLVVFVVDFSFLPSNSFSCCTAYSSTGSTMYNTSRPFFRRFSRNGDDDTWATLSPVM